MPFFFFLIIVLATSFAAPAQADLLNVSSPNIRKGVLDFGFGNAVEEGPDGGTFLENDLEIDYGATRWWRPGIEFGIERQPGDRTRYVSTAIRNMVKFADQKDGDLMTAALRIEYETAHIDGAAEDLRARFFFQRKVGPVTGVANLGVVRELGADRAAGLIGDVRGSLRYEINQYLVPSIDYVGDTGSLHELSAFELQDHRIGPTLQGQLVPNISYEVGYLAGLTVASPNHSLKLNIGFAF